MLINERFKVNRDTQTLTDTHANIETKLEPRFMKLLLLLVGNNGTLVSREKIVQDIWDNYGGADEGLNQAVSFLRKTLNDTEKELIKTVPKNGYIFNGRVSMDQPGVKRSGRTKWLVAGFLVLALIISLGIIFLAAPSPKTGPASEPPGAVIDTGHPSVEQKELQYKDSTEHN